MAVSIKIPYNEPFYDIVEQNWGLLEDLSEHELYWKLDDIYQHFTDEEFIKNPEWAGNMTEFELEKFYNDNLPKLIAGALRKYADQLDKGEIKFVVDWNRQNSDE